MTPNLVHPKGDDNPIDTTLDLYTPVDPEPEEQTLYSLNLGKSKFLGTGSTQRFSRQ